MLHRLCTFLCVPVLFEVKIMNGRPPCFFRNSVIAQRNRQPQFISKSRWSKYVFISRGMRGFGRLKAQRASRKEATNQPEAEPIRKEINLRERAITAVAQEERVIFSPATVSRRFPFERVKRRNCTKNRPRGWRVENHFAHRRESAAATAEHSILPVPAGRRVRAG